MADKSIVVVTVCLDVEGLETTRGAVERSFAAAGVVGPTNPTLLDQRHQLGEALGVVNIPNAVWIDENGMLVRPVEPAWPGPRPATSALAGTDLPDRVKAISEQAALIQADRDAYAVAVRDWAELGAASRYVLSADEVIARSQPRDIDRALAAAHFELGQYFHRLGQADSATPHFKASHELQPENWTYKRQAWELSSRVGGPLDRFWQGPMPGQEEVWPYDGDWLTDIKSIGAAQYYPAFVP